MNKILESIAIRNVEDLKEFIFEVLSEKEKVLLFKNYSQLTQLLLLDIKSDEEDGEYPILTHFSDLDNWKEEEEDIDEILDIILEKEVISFKQLKDSELNCLVDVIHFLPGLQELSIEETPISSLDILIDRISNIKVLRLYKCEIGEISKSIGNLKKLTRLDLSHNSISHIPSEFRNLNKLQDLSLNGNNLSSFPAVLLGLKELTSLSVRKNAISGDFPKAKEPIKRFTFLDISKNDFSDVSELIDIPKCHLVARENPAISVEKPIVNIRELQIEGSQVHVLNKISNLEVLQIRGGDRSIMVSEFAHLTGLKKLFIKDVLIESLAGIANLKELTELRLGFNTLTELNEDVYRLSNLEEISLEVNEITQISTRISQLKKLKNLNLKYNKIESIPLTIFELDHLESLILIGNPISDSLKEEMRKMGTTRVLF